MQASQLIQIEKQAKQFSVTPVKSSTSSHKVPFLLSSSSQFPLEPILWNRSQLNRGLQSVKFRRIFRLRDCFSAAVKIRRIRLSARLMSLCRIASLQSTETKHKQRLLFASWSWTCSCAALSPSHVTTWLQLCRGPLISLPIVAAVGRQQTESVLVYKTLLGHTNAGWHTSQLLTLAANIPARSSLAVCVCEQWFCRAADKWRIDDRALPRAWDRRPIQLKLLTAALQLLGVNFRYFYFKIVIQRVYES